MATERTTRPNSPDIDTLRSALYVSIWQNLRDARAKIPPIERIGQRKKLFLTSYPKTPQEKEAIAFREARKTFTKAVRQGVQEFHEEPYAKQYQAQLIHGAAYLQEVIAIHLRRFEEPPLAAFLDDTLTIMHNPFSLHAEITQHESAEEIRIELLGAGLFADFLKAVLQKPVVYAGRKI